MVGGVISDIYHAQDRNTPMALFAGAALFGTGMAPMIAGAIVTHSTWRWIYYSHAIVSAVFVVIIFFFFKETRGSVLLSRKAHKLNTYYEQLEEAGHIGVILSSEEASEEKSIRRIRWKVKSDEQRDSLATMIRISMYRPFRKLSRKLHALEHIADNLLNLQTCSSLSPWSSFSPCGYPSAGLLSTSNSDRCLLFSRKPTASTSSRPAPYLLVSRFRDPQS